MKKFKATVLFFYYAILRNFWNIVLDGAESFLNVLATIIVIIISPFVFFYKFVKIFLMFYNTKEDAVDKFLSDPKTGAKIILRKYSK